MDIVSLLLVVTGLVATIGTVSFGIPQAIKVTRDRAAEGVSQTTWWLALAICWPWGAYGFQSGDWFLLITNIAAALVAVWVLAACNPGRTFRVLLRAIALSAVAVTILAVAPVNLLVIVATATLVASRAPQLLLLFRVQTAKDVSIVTWWLSLLTGASWTIYGLLKADPVIYVANGIATAMTIAIVVRLLVFQASKGRASSAGAEGIVTEGKTQEKPNSENFSTNASGLDPK